MKKKTVTPQISDVEILDYPVKAGSGNIGIKAKVLGEIKHAVIGLDSEIRWRKASDEEKPVVAMGIAARTWRLDMYEALGKDFSKLQSPGMLMYHEWNRLGRQYEGVTDDFCVRDKNLFPDDEEVEMTFDIHDGFAVGEFEGNEYIMTYPLMNELTFNDRMKEKVENYIGRAAIDTGINEHDMALTFGKIEMVKPAVQELQWDKDRTIYQNAQIKPDMLKAILQDAGYTCDRRFPVKLGGCVTPGYIVMDENGKVDKFLLIPGQDHKVEHDAFYKNMPQGISTTFDLYSAWKEKMCTTRVSDINVRQAPGDAGRIFITCKVDGVQQLSRQLDSRDTKIYKSHQKEGLDSPLAKDFLNGLAVNYFKDAILNERSQNVGVKR